MEVDPWNVHASWHIEAADMATGRARLPRNAPEAELVLRFSDVSPQRDRAPSTAHSFDIEVNEDAVNWYVNLWRDGRRYSAEIGLRGAGGAFAPLARSNEVATPRGGPSPELDFRQVEILAPKAALGSGLPPTDFAQPHDALLKDLFPRRRALEDEFPLAMLEFPAQPPEEALSPTLQDAEPEAAVAAPSAETSSAQEQAASGAQGDGMLSDEVEVFPTIGAAEIRRYADAARAVMEEMQAEEAIPELPPIVRENVAQTEVELAARPLPIPPAPEGSAVQRAEPESAASDDARAVSAPSPTPRPAPVALEAVLGQSLSSSVFGVSGRISASIVIEGYDRTGTPLYLFSKAVPVDADGRFEVKVPLELGQDLATFLYRSHTRRHME